MRRSSIPRRQHEQILTAARIERQQEVDRLRALLAEAADKNEVLTADRDRLRAERDQFAKDRDTHRAIAEAAARKTSPVPAPAPAFVRPDAPLDYPKPGAPDAELRKRLHRAERAWGALDAQCLELQLVNERMYRELYDRAGEAS